MLVKKIKWLFLKLFGRVLVFSKTLNINEKCNRKPYLFYDKTNIFFSDAGTGIQRVANKVYQELKKIVNDYEIVDVYSKSYRGYFYCENGKRIKIQKGDILLSVDCAFFTLYSNRIYMDKLYHKGVRIYSFIYDLIPLKFPQYATSASFEKIFLNWLKTAVRYTGIITDSNAVLKEVREYLITKHISYNKDLKFDYVHLGANFAKDEQLCVSKRFDNEKLIFLMVSTVEPRKKYDQVIKAFNILWNKKFDIILQIVGHPGWRNDETINMIRDNKFLNKNLFWFDKGISDNELKSLYCGCSAVIFASLSEGFGLSLVEAAYYNKPLIIRDIPVFREIANDSAFYFDTLLPEILAKKIEEWITLYKQNKIVLPRIESITWNDCAKKVFEIIVSN